MTADGSVHPVARAGFAEAGLYERARPGYPPAVVAWLTENLRLAPSAVAVDLAAGTGKLTRLLAGVERRAPWRDHDGADEDALGGRDGFGPVQRAMFHHHQRITPEGVVDRFRSVSHVAVLPEPERAAVLAEVRAVLSTHPDTAGRDELLLPYRVDCLCFERR